MSVLECVAQKQSRYWQRKSLHEEVGALEKFGRENFMIFSLAPVYRMMLESVWQDDMKYYVGSDLTTTYAVNQMIRRKF